MTTEIIYLLIGIGFVVLLTAIVTKIVVIHGKPTIVNHGTIHNHYYGEQREEKPKRLGEETVPLIVEGVVETLKTINSGDEQRRNRDSRTSRRRA
jgi:primosomal replication protein N